MTSLSPYDVYMYRNGTYVSKIPVSIGSIAKTINGIYYCSLDTPLTKERDKYYYEIDNDIVIYRRTLPRIYNFYKRIFEGKILDRYEWETAKGTQPPDQRFTPEAAYVHLGVYGLNEPLTRRDVDFQAGGSSQTLKTDYADDMMKEIVNENMGSGASAARQFPSANWSEAVDVSAAPSITFEFAHQNVYKVLLKIAEISAQDGTALYFNVVAMSPVKNEFRTYTNQLGADTTKSILFADFYGNIQNAKPQELYSKEYNVVNAWGSGDPGNQDKSQQEDTERSGRSPWARREYSFQADGNIDSDALASLAKAALRQGRPRLIMECDLLDTELAPWGISWDFGDKVRVNFNGRNYSGLVRSLQTAWNVRKGETRFNAQFMYTSSITAGGTGIP